MIDRFISWLYTRKILGSRCSEYDPTCHCCEAWAIHDWLFNGLAHPEERNEALWAGQERPMTGFIKTLSDEQQIVQDYVRSSVPNSFAWKIGELSKGSHTIDTSRMTDDDFIALLSRK